MPSAPAALFLTVVGLRFLLACTVAVFACVALLLLSPDRSAGGRIFAAAAFAGNIFCGMVLGGALVSDKQSVGGALTGSQLAQQACMQGQAGGVRMACKR